MSIGEQFGVTPNMRPKRFEHRVTFCATADMEKKLRDAADHTMTTASDYSRRAIVEKLQRDGFFQPAPDMAAA